jgi:hypothetical protein
MKSGVDSIKERVEPGDRPTLSNPVAYEGSTGRAGGFYHPRLPSQPFQVCRRSETPKVMGVAVSPLLRKVRQQGSPTTTGKALGVGRAVETGKKTVSGWHPRKTAGGWPRHKTSAPDNLLCLYASVRKDHKPGRHTVLDRRRSFDQLLGDRDANR